MKHFIALTALLLTYNLAIGQNHYSTEIDQLSEEEIELLRKVEEYHKDLKFTKDVTRHYILKNGEKELIKTTLNFTKDIDGFYFEYYIYYSIELSADLTSISYSYSIGKAASSEGKINILGGVIRNDFSFGTSSGTLTIWFNEKLIFEQTADF